MSLDECIEYLHDDELLEVTPESLRIRKRILDKHERGRQTKRAKAVVKQQLSVFNGESRLERSQNHQAVS
jgi:hypothetical protein